MIIIMLIADNLKNIRVNLNKTQQDMASIINVNRSTYALWETGNNIFPIKRLLLLCDILNLSLDYIFGLIDNNINISGKFDIIKAKSRLQEFRKDNKITQDRLANKLNTTKAVISGYETGRRIIATPFLYTICKKYDISADYLMGRTDNPKYLK